MQYITVKDIIICTQDLSSMKITKNKIEFALKGVTTLRYDSIEFENEKLAQEAFDEAKKALTKK